MDTAGNDVSFPGQQESAAGFAVPINTALSVARQIAAGQASSTISIGYPPFIGIYVGQGTSSDPQQQAEAQQQNNGFGGFGGGNGFSNGSGNGGGQSCYTSDANLPVPSTIAPVNSGTLVVGTICGSPAATAGVTAGSVVTSVNGQAVGAPPSLHGKLAQFRPGDTVSLTWVTPSGQHKTATMTLTAGPPSKEAPQGFKRRPAVVTLDHVYDFDVLVIGSGPGGQKAAIAAAKLERRVAIIERKDMMGGVCLNTGTIPSKTLREAILYLTGIDQREMYGQSYRVKDEITIADLAARTTHVVGREMDVVRSQLSRNRVTTMTGTGRFLDPHAVEVDGGDGRVRRASADKIVIATGTRRAGRPASSSTSAPSSIPTGSSTWIRSRARWWWRAPA